MFGKKLDSMMCVVRHSAATHVLVCFVLERYLADRRILGMYMAPEQLNS